MHLTRFTAALPFLGGVLALARRAEEDDASVPVPKGFILEYSQVGGRQYPVLLDLEKLTRY